MNWEPIIWFMGPEESFSPKTERDHQTQILCYNCKILLPKKNKK
jgi:hypothetical protein